MPWTQAAKSRWASFPGIGVLGCCSADPGAVGRSSRSDTIKPFATTNLVVITAYNHIFLADPGANGGAEPRPDRRSGLQRNA